MEKAARAIYDIIFTIPFALIFLSFRRRAGMMISATESYHRPLQVSFMFTVERFDVKAVNQCNHLLYLTFFINKILIFFSSRFHFSPVIS